MAKLTDEGNKLFENVAKEMAQYEKVIAQSQFTKRENFLARYSGLGAPTLWKDEYVKFDHDHSIKSGKFGRYETGVTPLDLEKAKPFIRAVIERMLDLLDSEDRWIKNAEHRTENGVEKYCLIGAQAQALSDLTLNSIKMDPVVEEQRKKVIAAVDRYLRDALQKEHGFNSLPSFNDATNTDFEDVRLWLKSALGSLD